MRGRSARRFLVTAVTAAAFALSVAGTGQADPSGPQAFFFGVYCTGLGEVVLSNAGPSRAAGLQVVDSTTVVIVAKNRGLEEMAIAAGTSCTFETFGPTPDDLEPVEGEPQTVPVVIVG
jgi:hypothetical protein